MARYIGPKSKIARKFSDPIYGPDKYFEKKSSSSRQQGGNRRRRKQSEYGIQLQEKQKAKYTYGMLERQFRNVFKKASRKKGITGENLLKLIEARLDNVVFRLGIAPTRSAARQFVSHRHVTVNGGVVNIPSYSLKEGDIVGVREKSKSLLAINESLSGSNKTFSWLEWDEEKMQGKFLNYPPREEIPENIKEQLIVELYSK